jgi:alpha-L-fucosidase
MTLVKQVSSEGLRWFQDARFGMFIHWGLYALLAKHEWIMHIEKIAVPEYEKLVAQFNPTNFNAEEWVSIAADAGQKYMVFTSRHHDGFSMYDTALSDYRVTNTPFRRDPAAELADACARRGDIKLGFYSSLLDWHHPGYRFREQSGLAWSDYLEFLHGQVRELCTRYGSLACIWFDGDWPLNEVTDENAYFQAGGSFAYETLYDMIHTLQPDAVIINNRHDKPLPGEDVQGFEQVLPGMSGGYGTTDTFGLPLEVCMTLNDNWGYSAGDVNHKWAEALVHYLARSASMGANYLLNVGPTPKGEILPIHRQRLAQVGEWLRDNGASIYGTRAGAVAASADVVSTRNGDTHFIHVLNQSSDCVKLPADTEFMSARLLRDGSPVQFERQDDGLLVLTIPEEKQDRFDTVVVLA